MCILHEAASLAEPPLQLPHTVDCSDRKYTISGLDMSRCLTSRVSSVTFFLTSQLLDFQQLLHHSSHSIIKSWRPFCHHPTTRHTTVFIHIHTSTHSNTMQFILSCKTLASFQNLTAQHFSELKMPFSSPTFQRTKRDDQSFCPP